MATTTANLSLIKPEATDNITPTIFAENFEKIDSNVVTTYTHTKSGKVHNFVGKGATGKAKITANYVAGATFAVNGVAVNAYVGADAPDGDTIANGRWVMFVYDGTQLNFKGGGGVGSTKLAAATATAAQVLSGKTFYAGNKTLKTGTIARKGAESKTITPSGSAQSYTFATSGKYCSGNMTVTVPGTTIHNTSWPVRSDVRGSTMSLETRNIGAPDGAGTYAWTATCGTWNGNENSPVEFHFMGNDYGVKWGNAQNFSFSGINYFDSSTTYTGRQMGGYLWFYYVRLY